VISHFIFLTCPVLTHTCTVYREKFTYTLVLHRDMLMHTYTVHRDKFISMLVVHRDMLMLTYKDTERCVLISQK